MSTSARPRILATCQQSRFHAATLDSASTEIDLADVCISVTGADGEAELEVLVDAVLKLKEETRYGLVGRNGSGKSTLLRALADKLIPGLPPSLRVQLVTQIDEDYDTGDSRSPGGDTRTLSPLSVMQRVLYGHVERRIALEEQKLLARGLETDSPLEAQNVLDTLLLRRAESELAERQKRAQRRSGARGKLARAEEIEGEKEVEEAMKRLEIGKIQVDTVARLTEMKAEVQVTLELIEDEGIEDRARAILKGLGFIDEMIDGLYSSLSGGWRSRCRLATALLVPTDLLLLDEPSNFMDLSSVLWLERVLPTLTTYTTLIITSHDQILLDRLSQRTIHLRHRRLDYFDGPPSLMAHTEAETRISQTKTQNALSKQRSAIESSILNAKRSAKDKGDDGKARQAKTRQKKLDERFGVEKSAKGTRFKLNRDMAGYHFTSRMDVQMLEREKGVRLGIRDPAEMRGKGALVSMENMSVGYAVKGERRGTRMGRERETVKMVLSGVSMSIHPESRTAFVGANGEGKSTLAKAILSAFTLPSTKPSSSSPPTTSLRITNPPSSNPHARIALFNQHTVEALAAPEIARRTALSHLCKTISEVDPGIPGETGITEAAARGFLGSLGLHGSTASDVPIGSLSGGQRVRLGLGLILYRPPHLLILDEVTTHLDAPTIRALAKALKKWKGAIVLITHDRWFSSVIVDGRPISDDSDSEDDANDDERDGGEKERGTTYLVGKGKVKVLERGMEQYEEIVRRRVEKREKASAD